MELTGAAQLGLQVFDGLLGPFKEALPQVPETFWEEIRAEVSAEKLLDHIVPIYRKHLSQADAEALVAFWSSPVGQRFVEKQPIILQESMAVGQEWGEDLATEVFKSLRERGYGISASGPPRTGDGPETARSRAADVPQNPAPAPGG